jgi:hypothetical protein
LGNPLSSALNATPPAPEMPTQQASPGANALTPPGAVQPQAPSQGGQPQQQQLPPAPSHAQTVTALRHFGALESELMKLMKDPDLGKDDVRSQVIDAMTRLVSKGIVPAAGAVKDLGTLPDKPYDQRAWVNQHFQNVVQAQSAILAHHQHGAMTGQNVGPSDTPSPDDHQATMSTLQSRYKGMA